jgi:hypothetical protein
MSGRKSKRLRLIGLLIVGAMKKFADEVDPQ